MREFPPCPILNGFTKSTSKLRTLPEDADHQLRCVRGLRVCSDLNTSVLELLQEKPFHLFDPALVSRLEWKIPLQRCDGLQYPRKSVRIVLWQSSTGSLREEIADQ